jgi:hypothetical protein
MENKTTTIEYKDRFFEIDTLAQTRVVAFKNGKPVYGDYTQWNIREDGQLKGFVFEADLVLDAIHRMVDFPNEAEAINCRFD